MSCISPARYKFFDHTSENDAMITYWILGGGFIPSCTHFVQSGVLVPPRYVVMSHERQNSQSISIGFWIPFLWVNIFRTITTLRPIRLQLNCSFLNSFISIPPGLSDCLRFFYSFLGRGRGSLELKLSKGLKETTSYAQKLIQPCGIEEGKALTLND